MTQLQQNVIEAVGFVLLASAFIWWMPHPWALAALAAVLLVAGNTGGGRGTGETNV